MRKLLLLLTAASSLCFKSFGQQTDSLMDMLNGDNQVADIQVTVLVKGKTTVTNNASVTGNVSDPNKANDSAAITVSVVAGTTAKPRK